MTICYFTATGSCLHVAGKIGDKVLQEYKKTATFAIATGCGFLSVDDQWLEI